MFVSRKSWEVRRAYTKAHELNAMNNLHPVQKRELQFALTSVIPFEYLEKIKTGNINTTHALFNQPLSSIISANSFGHKALLLKSNKILQTAIKILSSKSKGCTLLIKFKVGNSKLLGTKSLGCFFLSWADNIVVDVDIDDCGTGEVIFEGKISIVGGNWNCNSGGEEMTLVVFEESEFDKEEKFKVTNVGGIDIGVVILGFEVEMIEGVEGINEIGEDGAVMIEFFLEWDDFWFGEELIGVVIVETSSKCLVGFVFLLLLSIGCIVGIVVVEIKL